MTTPDVSLPAPSPATFGGDTVPPPPPVPPAPAATADVDAGYGSLRKGIRFAGYSVILSALLGFANALVNSRLYGVDVVGEYALLCTPWFILQTISTINERTALTRELATLPRRSREATGVFGAVLAFSFALTLFMALVVAIFTVLLFHGPVGAPQLVLPAILVLAGYLLLLNTAWVYDGVLVAHGGTGVLAFGRVVLALMLVLGSVIFRPFTDSYWGPTLGTLLAFACGFVVRAVTVRKYLVGVLHRSTYAYGRRVLPSILRFGLTLVPSYAAMALFSNAPVLILGSTASIAVVGAFSRASGMALRGDEMTYRFSEILFPAMVRRWKGRRYVAFETTLARGAGMIFAAFCFIAVVIGPVSRDFLDVFGSGFSQAGPVLTILLFYVAVNAVAILVHDSYLAAGRTAFVSFVGTMCPLVAATLLYPFAVLWGANGVAAAMLVSPSLRVIFLVGSMAPRLTSYAARNRLLRRLFAIAAAATLAVLLGIEVGTFIDRRAVRVVATAAASVLTYSALVVSGRLVSVKDVRTMLSDRFGSGKQSERQAA